MSLFSRRLHLGIAMRGIAMRIRAATPRALRAPLHPLSLARSGNGPETHYEEFPSTDTATGAVSYDKVFKYRQGVIFNFRTAGLLYKMNWQCAFLPLNLGALTSHLTSPKPCPAPDCMLASTFYFPLA